MNTRPEISSFLLCLCAFALTVSPRARGEDFYWTNNGTAATFANANNWLTNGAVAGRAPEIGDNAWFTNATTYTLNWTSGATNANANFNSAGSGATLNIGSANAWWLTNRVSIGQQSATTAAVTLVSGTWVVTNDARTGAFVVGEAGKGTFALTSNAALTVDQLYVTNTGRSTFNFNGGTLTTLAGSAVTGALAVGSGALKATWYMNGGANTMSGGALTLGKYTGASGLLQVNGSGTVFTNTVGFTLGDASGASDSQLIITNGGKVYLGGYLYIGYGALVAASNNVVVVTGTGSVLKANLSGQFRLGEGGYNNRLIISDGGLLETIATSYIGGNSAGGSNVAIVAGSGSFWSNSVQIVFGNSGNDRGGNQLIITNGGMVYAGSSTLAVGKASGSSGTNAIWVADGGILWANRLSTGAAAGNVISNSGGVFQFSTAYPTITVTRYGDIVVTNGTLAYLRLNSADVWGSYGVLGDTLANILFQGANTFRLNNSSNTSAASPQNYTFAAGISPSNYAGLEMINGGTAWRSAWLNIGSGGRMLVSNTTATVQGVTTNSGIVTVMNASATWRSNVVNLGAWVSDPSTNAFNGSFTVGPTGYVSAAGGDVYAFGGNFIMGSTNPAFNLASARVVFATNGFGLSTTTANHLLSVSNSGALDIGQGYTNFSQVASNYALGALSIESGDRLTIAGNKGGATTNALYVGWLDIQGTFDTNSYTAVTNALVLALNLPNINVYYDKYDSRNGWLNANLINDSASGYQLWGPTGGLLLPIPEPTTLLALGASLGLLAFLRRRKFA